MITNDEQLSQALDQLGGMFRALASLRKALSLEPDRPSVQFRAALVYNHFGDTDLTFRSLQKATASGLSADLVNNTPDFDHLHTDPRFRAILPGAK